MYVFFPAQWREIAIYRYIACSQSPYGAFAVTRFCVKGPYHIDRTHPNMCPRARVTQVIQPDPENIIYICRSRSPGTDLPPGYSYVLSGGSDLYDLGIWI